MKTIQAEIKYSKKYNIAYINNPKVGCTTIKRSLIGYDVDNIHDHKHFSKIKDQNASIFTVVRNPFVRALSGYLNKIGLERDDPYTWKNFTKRYGISESDNISFKEFLTFLDQDKEPETIDPHFRQQYFNISFDTLKPNFIGRLESMKDVEIYLSAFKVRIETRDGNKTEAKKKLEKYYDEDIIELVKRIYSRDFENFGYSTDFNNNNYLPPIIDLDTKVEILWITFYHGRSFVRRSHQ